MNLQKKLKVSLLALRYGVALVLLMWTIDKLARPEHAAGVFEKFYFLPNFSHVLLKAVGILELLLIAAFLVGSKKRFTYGAVFAIHAVSTISSYRQYLDPFSGGNLLFFAAWPMLAACFALYVLRDEDTLLTVCR